MPVSRQEVPRLADRAHNIHRHWREAALAQGQDVVVSTLQQKFDSTAKVNIDTDGRLVWTRVHREFFRDHPDQFDFRPPGKIFVEEYAKFIAHKNEKLGSANQLDGVRATL